MHTKNQSAHAFLARAVVAREPAVRTRREVRHVSVSQNGAQRDDDYKENDRENERGDGVVARANHSGTVRGGVCCGGKVGAAGVVGRRGSGRKDFHRDVAYDFVKFLYAVS